MVRFKLLLLLLKPLKDVFGGHSKHWLYDVADPVIAIFSIKSALDDWRTSSLLGSDINMSNNVTWEAIDVI